MYKFEIISQITTHHSFFSINNNESLLYFNAELK